MADIYSEKKRSEIMRGIGNKDSKIEVLFRKALWKEGFRYRKNSKKYFGTPDIVLKSYKTVIFIDSCFWHGCKEHGSLPVSNRKFWRQKMINNSKRDRNVNAYYRKLNWCCVRIWEHDIADDVSKTIRGVVVLLTRSSFYGG